MSTVTAPGFVEWLRSQAARQDMLGELARSVKSDPRGAQLRSAEDVSKRLNQDQASWEYHDALEEAEAEWRRVSGL